MLWKLQLVVLALLLPASISCAKVSSTPDSGRTVPYYAGLKLGPAHMHKALTDTNDSDSSTNLAYGIFAGYRFDNYLSLEGSYNYLGKDEGSYSSGGSDNEYRSDARTFDLSGRASWPFSAQSSIYAKGGLCYFNVRTSGPSDTKRETGFAPTIGTGFEYRGSNNISSRLEFQFYNDIGGPNTGESDAHMVSFSILYNFGELK